MKVLCKSNNLNGINAQETVARLKRYIFMPDGEIDLQIGKQYVVYGIGFRDNCPWFYICTEDYDDYPKPFSLFFFDIIDKRLSKHWQFCFDHEGCDNLQTTIAFPEWAGDTKFYMDLVEGEDQAVATFAKYRALIDQEV